MIRTESGLCRLDPMCGSGTAGEACLRPGGAAILCDASEEYTLLAEKRLGISRGPLVPGHD